MQSLWASLLLLPSLVTSPSGFFTQTRKMYVIVVLLFKDVFIYVQNQNGRSVIISSRSCFCRVCSCRPQNTLFKHISMVLLRKSQSSSPSGTDSIIRCTLPRCAQRGCCSTSSWKPTCKSPLPVVYSRHRCGIIL